MRVIKFKPKIIYETEDFIVKTPEYVQVDRDEGGHVVICLKKSVTDRTQLTPKKAIEYIRLSMIVGEALPLAMKKQGVKAVKVNYEDIGNYALFLGKVPEFHLHIFGRTYEAKIQEFPMPIKRVERTTGFYDSFKPLNDLDIRLLGEEIQKLLMQEKYQDSIWKS